MRQLPLRIPHAPSSAVALPLLTIVLILTMGLGCSRELSGPDLVPLTLKAQGVGGPVIEAAATPEGRVATAPGLGADDPIDVALSEAYLVVRDVRFKFPEGADDPDSPTDSIPDTSDDSLLGARDDDDEDDGEIRFTGPYVIDLLSGLAQDLDTKMVPPGEYRRVQGHLQALRGNEAAAEGKSFLVGNTVYLAGTISGESGGPFTFATRIDTEFMIRGGFQVDADTPATSFVTFDLDRWLKDRDGRFLDPRDSDNAHAIEMSIRHSVKVGMDEDEDGEPDDEEMNGLDD